MITDDDKTIYCLHGKPLPALQYWHDQEIFRNQHRDVIGNDQGMTWNFRLIVDIERLGIEKFGSQ